MQDRVYIEKISVDKFRTIEKLNIEVKNPEFKDIILTGKNGSGKTSLLSLIYEYFETTYVCNAKLPQEYPINIKMSDNFKYDDHFVFSYLKADRVLKFKNSKYDSNSLTSYKWLLKYLEALVIGSINPLLGDKEQRRSLMFKSEIETLLGALLGYPDLIEIFIDKNLNINIKVDDDISLLNNLPDGYKSILSIIGSILVNCRDLDDFDQIRNIQGIMLIDEIETHLHAELQKNIVYILKQTFPNIQFIISTHSPIILSATENVLVYDVAKNSKCEDLIEYGLDRILKMYFGVEIENAVLWAKYSRLKELIGRVEDEDSLYLYREDIKFLIKEIRTIDSRLTPTLKQKIESLISNASEMLGEQDV